MKGFERKLIPPDNLMGATSLTTCAVTTSYTVIKILWCDKDAGCRCTSSLKILNLNDGAQFSRVPVADINVEDHDSCNLGLFVRVQGVLW